MYYYTFSGRVHMVKRSTTTRCPVLCFKAKLFGWLLVSLEDLVEKQTPQLSVIHSEVLKQQTDVLTVEEEVGNCGPSETEEVPAAGCVTGSRVGVCLTQQEDV